jgi:uncharacterized damage-inducible protein DinB
MRLYDFATGLCCEVTDMSQGLIELVRTLYAYDRWANRQIVEAAQRLTASQLLTPINASLPSVRDTLVHIMDAQQTWITRFQELPPPLPLRPEDFPDLASMLGRWQTIEADIDSFVRTLADDVPLTRVIHYVNARGEPNAYPLWQMMVHLVNHGTQHRSEVAARLTEMGSSPGWLDLLIYVDSIS